MEKRKSSSIIIQSVFLAAAVVFSLVFFTDLAMKNRRTRLPFFSSALEEWEWVHADGSRETVTLPVNLNVSKGENVVLERRAPYIAPEGYWLMFFNEYDVRIYVDDVLRYRFDRGDADVYGGIVKGAWSFTRLYKSDSGKTIRIERISDETYNGTFKELYYGDALGDTYNYVKKHVIFYFASIMLIVLADVMIIVGTFTHWIGGHRVALVKLGIGMMCASLWLVFKSDIFQFVFNNYYIDGAMSYMAITLTPIPLLQYIDQMQKNRRTKMHQAMCGLALTVAIVLAALHFSGIWSYEQSRYVTIATYCILTIGALYTIIVDHRAGYMEQYRYVAYGMYGFLVMAVIEMVLVIVQTGRDEGAVLLVGFYILFLGGLVQQVVETAEADRARRQAQEASKQKSTFLANMSHEIRTPINSIIGMNEMILRENTDPKIREYAQEVANSGRLLLGLINDVLDFSKIEAGKLDIVSAPFETAVFINDIEQLLKERAGNKHLRSEFIISRDIPAEISGDEVHLKQILVNLISNAVKYTHEGSVTLSIDFSEAVAEDTIDLRMSVIDTGIGIRQENLDRLFEIFTRVDERRNSSIEGTGLGLSIVKSLVDAMGGTIDVESSYGAGSTFTVTLPFMVVDPTPIGDINAEGRELGRTEKYVEKFHAPEAHILAVDDNLVNLKVVCELLKATRIKIDTASGGRECVYMCRDKQYDLILMDHRMPDPDGIETLRLLRDDFGGLNAATPVIVLTANASAGVKDKYVAEGFVDYLSKPINSKMLETVIMKHLPENLVITDFNVNDAKVNNISGTTSPESVPDEPAKSELSTADRLRAVKDMDYDATASTYGNSEEFMVTLLSTIVEEGYNKISRMETAFRDKDYKNYRVDAHAAKSDMATIGATVMSERAKAHEYAVRDENYSFIEQDCSAFLEEYRRVLDSIGAALK